jgi:hypothetical protein
MFYGCKAMKIIDASMWDIKNNCEMSSMFNTCESAEEIKIDTSKATSVGYMFRYCRALKTGTFDLSNCTNATGFLEACTSLESVNIANSSNCGDMSRFFFGCTSIENIDLDVSGAYSVAYIVYNCYNTTKITLRGLGSQPTLDMNVFTAFYASSWGTGSEEARKTLVDTFLTYSCDRVAKGYDPIEIVLQGTQKNLLTDEEKAAITAKGFTIV